MVRAAIALGSNLGDRGAILSVAVSDLLGRLAGASVSAFIETDAVGVGAQPAFLNGAIAGWWAGDARALLSLLMRLEGEAARERPYPGAARTLDLDLILFGAAMIREPDLVVPHPRFRERGFVLQPLAQVAPDMVDPVSGLSVIELYGAWQAARYQDGIPARSA
jgi:2-amino-4-hydroxy-6-hydroxymethyldihydropteridine diphosphokinase